MNVKINSESNETQHQTVSFSDQNQQWTYGVEEKLDSVHHTADSNDADLNNFFSRPIRIATINWTVGSTFSDTINPWTLYFENDRVINRISNYNVMRSKLKVKILINGNGFHYGRALASYRPLPQDDNMITWRMGLVPQDIIGASQRMHVWLDPTKSQGGTLELPYVFWKNAMNVPDMDWREMGELDIASITTLAHANGGSDAITISVFAWAEDVALSIPTIATPGALRPQCLEEQSNEADQASSGPISGPAALVAKVAGSLTKVPIIGDMALATQTAASTIGATARLFGMSRPVDTGPIQSYKPTYVGNMANTNVLDTSTKLSLDVKQELTVDPSAVGLGPADEMAISSIAARESYLTQFAWNTVDIPETLLWNCYVEPMLFDKASPSGELEYHYTPMAYAALPFENWRGTIKYRFQIVASAFHKGRLKVVYEPYSSPLSTSEYNTQYTHIIDLAHERDFTVEIGWGQEYTYLDHRDLDTSMPFSIFNLVDPLHSQANGIVSIWVVNDLTTPSAVASNVSVLVSVCAGDDFEVVNPSNNLETVTFFQPQSALEEQSVDISSADADNTVDETAPISTDVVTKLALDMNMQDEAQKVYFGDPVTSIRQFMKRYVAYRCWSSDTNALPYSKIYHCPDFPMYRGWDTSPTVSERCTAPVDPTPFAFAFTTHLNWFTPAFLCRRGGIRHKFIFDGETDWGSLMSVSRFAEPIGYLNSSIYTEQGLSHSHSTVTGYNNMMSTTAGMVATPVTHNPTLEVELPFQSYFRFFPARKKNFNTGGVNVNRYHQLKFPGSQTGQNRVYDYVSVGEDFSLSFFQAVPVFWRTLSPPPSLLG
jgi:hypothetical protein